MPTVNSSGVDRTRTLGVSDLVLLAYMAGFRGNDLAMAVAIALAESGGNTGAIGDTKLANATWGPSVGLFQIRSLVAENGKGGLRDSTLNSDPIRNAFAAFTMYKARGGRFTDWSTYWKDPKNRVGPGQGKAAQYLNQVKTAIAQLGGEGSLTQVVSRVATTPQFLQRIGTRYTNPYEAARTVPGNPGVATTGGPVDWAALKAMADAGLTEADVRNLAAGAPVAPGGATTINLNFGPGLNAGGGITPGLSVNPPPLDPSASPAEVEAYFKKYYGAFAWMLNDPELRGVLVSAATNQTDAMGIQAALQGTHWWKSHSAAMRNWEGLAATDPYEAERQLQQKALAVKIEARKLGIDMDEARARDLAWTALRLGWSSQELQQSLVNEIHYSPNLGGDAGATIDAIKAKAKAYMVPLSDDTAFALMKKTASGEMSEEGLNHYFLSLAKSRYPTLSSYLDAGITPQQFFTPYTELAAKTLELNPNQISLLDDPRFASMIETTGADGKLRPMTLSEAGRYLRTLPDYRTTDQARSQGAELARSIGQLFGRAV